MTEPAPERALAALKTVGMEERPVASLERDDALFVLTGTTLLFQDGAGTRRVTLRDLTRIHSDQEGLLRVETPAGTALTASLLGFEPAEVQGFFAQVRDATARVKQLPAAPPAPLAKTFAPAPLSPDGVRPSPAAPPPPATPEPSPTEVPRITTISAVRPAARAADDREPEALTKAPEPADRVEASGAGGAPTSTLGMGEAPTRPEPVIISSSGFSPAPRRSEPRPAGPEVTEAKATVPRAAEPLPEAPSAPPTDLSLPAQSLPAPALPGVVEELAAQAGVVAALAGRLRLLGMVLFVGAVVLAFFQFSADQRLDALWTLLAGGVGTVTLTALSELARLLAALGRRLSGTLDERGTLNEH